MVLVAVAIAAASVALVVTRGASSSSTGALVVRSALPPRLASYLGVYESGPPHTYQPVTEFAKASGRHPNLVGYYSGWGVPFARSFAETVHSHGAVTILQMDPTYASIPAIAGGGIRPLPARVRRQCAGLRAPGGHRFRARDER